MAGDLKALVVMADPKEPNRPAIVEGLEKVKTELKRSSINLTWDPITVIAPQPGGLALREKLDSADFLLLDSAGPDPQDTWCEVGRIVGRAEAHGKPGVFLGPGYPSLLTEQPDGITYVKSKAGSWDDEARANLINALRLAVYRSLARAVPVYPVECYRDRDAAELFKACENAKEQVHILVTNLSWFSQDSGIDALVSALHKRVEVKILTLDPQSVFVAYRASQLGLQAERFRGEMESGLGKIYKRLSDVAPEGFEIRTYDDFPTQITIATEKHVYICTVARASRSRQGCIFKVRTEDPGVERSFIFHFDTLWTIARPYRS
jgi:hypothetical protein